MKTNKIGLIIIISILFISIACNELSNKLLVGAWQTTDVDFSELDVEKVNEVLIEESRKVSMQHSITFSKDSSFVETLGKTEPDGVSLRYSGKYKIKDSKIWLYTNKLEYQKGEEEWNEKEKNDFNKKSFEPKSYDVIGFNKNTLKIKYSQGVIATWEKKEL